MGRVLQFSDVHFGREHRDACNAALEFAHATPSDLVLITGDVTQKGLPDEFAAAGDWIRRSASAAFLLSPFSAPRSCAMCDMRVESSAICIVSR